jgi:Papain family cysteine protease
MPAKTFASAPNRKVTLDARPDRPDIRDRPYMPPLRALPPSSPPAAWITDFLPTYQQWKLVLDQGTEGACTGFGLAAVINYLYFRQSIEAAALSDGKAARSKPVSTRMLYHLARLYDEWPGEDYDGSSCRGAMKGWFHHGVCEDALWPYKPKGSQKPSFVAPAAGWARDAAQRPLGAYYRITRSSIADMQAAIHEVGAIYVSAKVHEGWSEANLKPAPAASLTLASVPTVPWSSAAAITGGHAFAIVGYDIDGFIVQNSWGAGWGLHGFARLTYADWLANGSDAWVAVMGAPVNGLAPSSILSSSRTISALAPELGRGLANGATAAAASTSAVASVVDTETITKHVVVLGNGGRPVQIRLDAADAASAVQDVAFTWPKEYFRKNPGLKPRIAIYKHGGLNDLAAGLARAKIMAPAFLDNEVYPIFVAWQSGFLDALGDILAGRFESDLAPNANVLKDIAQGITDASDRLLETATAPLASAIWGKIKDNATGASEAGGGVRLLIEGLARLARDIPGLEIHAVGHSAGAVMCGASLAPLVKCKLAYKTVSLYAPACTVGFANDTYLAQAGKAFRAADCVFDVLSNDNERADTVGPYRKSLLYFVSRACERHKTPLLGLEAAWNKAFDKDDLFIDTGGGKNRDVERWRNQWNGPKPAVLTAENVEVNTRTKATVGSVHGCFDNWVDCVSRSIRRIRGAPLKKPIVSLEGF